jgi:integrase
MCPYCSENHTRLPRHITAKHKDEEDVQKVLALPKKEQRTAFGALRKKGIYKQNSELLKTNAPDSALISQYNRPSSSTSQTTKGKKMCGNCMSLYSSKTIWKHKQNCKQPLSSTSTQLSHIPSIPISVLRNCPGDDPAFKVEVLRRFLEDEVGELCRTDFAIKTFGYHQWEKNAKGDRKPCMNEMRNLAKLVLECRLINKEKKIVMPFTGEDLLDKKHYELITAAMKRITVHDNNEEKNSLKMKLAYELRAAATTMQAVYLMEDKKELAENCSVFMTILKVNWGGIVNKAVYRVKKRRQELLRLPQQLPDEEEIRMIKDHITAELCCVHDNDRTWNTYLFNRLRAQLVCRLTLFNARRGGECARMTLKDWQYAKEDKWIDKKRTEKLYEHEKVLIHKYKLTYMEGKGQVLVPVLIPNDCMRAIQKLVDMRPLMGINPDNPHLFPAGRGSIECMQGSQAVNEVCQATGTKLTATTVRHRTATLYALMDLPDVEMRAFYKHMGHSQEINETVYQTPLGIMEITRVGCHLDKMDNIQDNAGK